MGGHRDNISTTWWNSDQNSTAYINFGKNAASEWFTSRIRALMTELDITRFKFVGGEVDLMPGVGAY